MHCSASIDTEVRVTTIRARRIAEHKVAVDIVDRKKFCATGGAAIDTFDSQCSTVSDVPDDGDG